MSASIKNGALFSNIYFLAYYVASITAIISLPSTLIPYTPKPNAFGNTPSPAVYSQPGVEIAH